MDRPSGVAVRGGDVGGCAAEPAPVLDITAGHRQAGHILRDPADGYGVGTVTEVVCNSGINPTVEEVAGFTCEAVVDGATRRIAVIFQDAAGTYAVDRPR